MSNLPNIKSGSRILIVCEGEEEYDYLYQLKTLNVWRNDIIIDFANAKSIDKIFAMYQYRFQQSRYKLIVVFCDTEKSPYKKFLLLKKKINEFHGHRVADHIIFFANPCTMQIILSHFGKVSLKSNQKSDNANLIKSLTGVSHYCASQNQRTAIMKKITPENYVEMKQNISYLDNNFETVPSTNCLLMFNGLEGVDKKWISNLTQRVNKP